MLPLHIAAWLSWIKVMGWQGREQQLQGEQISIANRYHDSMRAMMRAAETSSDRHSRKSMSTVGDFRSRSS